MLGRSHPQKSFMAAELEKQVSPHQFLERIKSLMVWKTLEPHWDKLYGDTGRPSHPLLVVFKMLLLQRWFDGLSDGDVERQCRDRYSFRKFQGVSTAEGIPNATVLVRFRKRLIAARIEQTVFDEVLAQLDRAGVILRRGTLVDATVVKSARKPPPKRDVRDAEETRDTSDPQAGWAIKNDKPVGHGYKAHVAVDQTSAIVRAVEVTCGLVHDSRAFDTLVPETHQTKAVYADKAYDDTQRRKELRSRGVFARILHKAVRNKELTDRQRHENRRWSKPRAGVERVFADWKERRGYTRARYLGVKKNRLDAQLMAICHNLRRWAVLMPAPA